MNTLSYLPYENCNFLGHLICNVLSFLHRSDKRHLTEYSTYYTQTQPRIRCVWDWPAKIITMRGNLATKSIRNKLHTICIARANVIYLHTLHSAFIIGNRHQHIYLYIYIFDVCYVSICVSTNYDDSECK